MNWARFIAILFVAIWLATACASPSSPPAAPPEPRGAEARGGSQAPTDPSLPAVPARPDRIRVAYTAPSASQAPLWIAKEAGLYEKYGLDVDLQAISSRQIVATAVAGDIDIGTTSPESIIASRLEGSDLVIIGTLVPTMQMTFFVRPEIKQPTDIKGKTVAVTGVGPGINRETIRYSLKKLGLDPDKDVTYVPMPSSTENIQALLSGAVQGAAIFPPQTVQARKEGMIPLVDVSRDNVEYPAGAVFVSRRSAAGNPDLVTRFWQALTEAIKVYKSDPAYAKRVFAQYAQMTDQELIDEAVDFAARASPESPKTTETGIKAILATVADQRPEAASMDPKTFIDNSYLERLERAGFISALYGR